MVKPGGVEKLVESLKDREQFSLMRDLVSAGSPGLMEVGASVGSGCMGYPNRVLA